MSRRRSPGEGSVSPTPDGSGWEARLDLGRTPNGRRLRRKRRARTKTEALRLLREMRADAESMLRPTSRTVEESVEIYLATRPTKGRAQKTIELDRWRANVVISGLGSRKVANLTVAECDRFLTLAGAGAFGTKPIGREALSRVRGLLVATLRNDMRLDLIKRNVADLSVLPAGDDDDDGDTGRRALTYAEFRRLELEVTDVLEIYFDLSARNGLRPAEARALRWSRVDLIERTLTVDVQMDAQNQLTDPKTKRAARTIPFDQRTGRLLGRWRQSQAKLSVTAQGAWTPEPDLIVTTAIGTPIERSNMVRSLVAACERADVDPITPYELRHTAITYQVEAGHEAWRIADWAGTSERMIEDVYRHRLSRVSDLSSVRLPPRDHQR